jgi:hypothetical protein
MNGKEEKRKYTHLENLKTEAKVGLEEVIQNVAGHGRVKVHQELGGSTAPGDGTDAYTRQCRWRLAWWRTENDTMLGGESDPGLRSDTDLPSEGRGRGCRQCCTGRWVAAAAAAGCCGRG